MKYYCTGEEIENGYLKCVVPKNVRPLADFDRYIASLPLAALVVGGKIGWLDEKDYEIEERFTGEVLGSQNNPEYKTIPVLVPKKSKQDWKIGDKFTTPETGDKVFTVIEEKGNYVEAYDGRSRAGITSFLKSYIKNIEG